MKKTKGIETRTRNVKQNYRRFSEELKRRIVMEITNRDKTISVDEAFRTHGIHKSQYYSWRKKFDVQVSPIVESHPMITIGKLVTVSVSVRVNSLMDLVNVCNDLSKTPKVKTILSVE